jgi:hypothetical protein
MVGSNTNLGLGGMSNATRIYTLGNLDAKKKRSGCRVWVSSSIGNDDRRTCVKIERFDSNLDLLLVFKERDGHTCECKVDTRKLPLIILERG